MTAVVIVIILVSFLFLMLHAYELPEPPHLTWNLRAALEIPCNFVASGLRWSGPKPL